MQQYKLGFSVSRPWSGKRKVHWTLMTLSYFGVSSGWKCCTSIHLISLIISNVSRCSQFSLPSHHAFGAVDSNLIACTHFLYRQWLCWLVAYLVVVFFYRIRGVCVNLMFWSEMCRFCFFFFFKWSLIYTASYHSSLQYTEQLADNECESAWRKSWYQ